MNVITILYILSLVNFCRCGDDEGRSLPVSKPESTSQCASANRPPSSSGDSDEDEDSAPIILDLTNPNHDRVEVEKRQYTRLSHQQITPKQGFHIACVVNDDTTIWQSENDSRCIIVHFYSCKTCIISLWLKVKNETRIERLENVNGEWKNITLEQFSEKVGEINETGAFPESPGGPLQASPSLYGPIGVTNPYQRTGGQSKDAASAGSSDASDFILDISNPNRSLVTMRRVTSPTGVTSSVLIKIRGQNIIFVVEGDSPIWTARAGDDFRSCFIYEKEGHSPIMRIHPGRIPNKCFVKVGGRWMDIVNDDYETRSYKMDKGLPGDLQEGEAALSSSGSPNCFCAEQAEPVGASCSKESPGNVEGDDKQTTISPFGASTPGHTLDIANPDESLVSFFEYCYDRIHRRMIIPRRKYPVTRILNGQETVWEGDESHKCAQCIVYLKNGQPDIALVVKISPSGTRDEYYERINGEWFDCGGIHAEKIRAMRTIVEPKGDIVMRLEDKEDGEEKKVFSLELFGVPFSSHVPNPGYSVVEVKDGEETLWKASGDERCVFCELYHNELSFPLLLISVNDKNSKYFENICGMWMALPEEDFQSKILEMSLSRKLCTEWSAVPPKDED